MRLGQTQVLVARTPFDASPTLNSTGVLDTSSIGRSTVTYSCTDGSGNAAEVVTRTVTVRESTNRVITLVGLSTDSFDGDGRELHSMAARTQRGMLRRW